MEKIIGNKKWFCQFDLIIDLQSCWMLLKSGSTTSSLSWFLSSLTLPGWFNLPIDGSERDLCCDIENWEWNQQPVLDFRPVCAEEAALCEPARFFFVEIHPTVSKWYPWLDHESTSNTRRFSKTPTKSLMTVGPLGSSARVFLPLPEFVPPIYLRKPNPVIDRSHVQMSYQIMATRNGTSPWWVSTQLRLRDGRKWWTRSRLAPILILWVLFPHFYSWGRFICYIHGSPLFSGCAVPLEEPDQDNFMHNLQQ